MDNLLEQYLPFLFPVAFVLIWLTATTILGVLSGWYTLMRRYPNREDEVLLELGSLSGSMGLGVSMQGILNISVCPSGLRVGMMRIFGIFARNFFVPWEDIRVRRKDRFLGPVADLQFGNPPVGRLSIAAHVADRLARSAAGHWPEAGPFPEERSKQAFASELKQWALSTIVVALFFILAPRFASWVGIFPSTADFPPVSVDIIFPGTLFGIVGLFRYFNRIRK